MLAVYSLGLICIITGFFPSLVKGEREIQKVLQRCCQIGRNAAEIAKCEAKNPIPGIAPEHQSFCLSAIELCCAHVGREIECRKGTNTAKSDSPCLSDKTMDEARCCQACRLGLITRIQEQPCSLGPTSFGRLWDSVYSECCEGAEKKEFDKEKEKEPSKNMCLMLPNELCHHNCVPAGQSYKCTCRQGFALMSDGKSCTPVEKECDGCSGRDCVQTVDGEMICISCSQGYRPGVDNKTCVPNEPAKIFNCPEGYRNNQYSTQDMPICEDIDECTEGLAECNDDEMCVNAIGTYKCSPKVAPISCRRGFVFNQEIGTCVDVDECEEVEDPPCDSNQNCINTLGSFECVCKTGFKQDPVTLACIDINECQQKLHDCVEYQRCDNTIGSYMCVRDINCGTGYTLNSQSGKCEDDDECSLGTHTCNLLGHDWECKNTHGSFRCVKKTECPGRSCSHVTHHCPSGYRVVGSTCVDINECEEGTARCGANQRCLNIKGNYLCSDIVSCKPGLRLNSAKTQCIDIDECSEQAGLCSHFCDNRWGTYRCRCRPGYKLNKDNRTCIDINECEGGPRCQGYCINQQGSFTCACPPGYRTAGFNKQLCADIDECSESVCNQEDICINIAGSYRCNQINCPPGYRKDGVHQNRCQKEDTSCLNEDLECRRQPTTYSYNYMTMVSNYTIPRSGSIKLFGITSMHSSTAPDFTFELVQARVPAGVKAATRNDFNLNKQYGKATIELVKPLLGPQEILLEIKTEFYSDRTLLGTQISSLEIYVSMYTF